MVEDELSAVVTVTARSDHTHCSLECEFLSAGAVQITSHHGRSSEGVAPCLRTSVRAHHHEVVAQDQVKGNTAVNS